jgi:UDP-2,3-diacylglucosamine hydrolase
MTAPSAAPLGIVAGGGDLPLAVAEAAAAVGRPVFVVGLTGSADPWI